MLRINEDNEQLVRDLEENRRPQHDSKIFRYTLKMLGT